WFDPTADRSTECYSASGALAQTRPGDGGALDVVAGFGTHCSPTQVSGWLGSSSHCGNSVADRCWSTSLVEPMGAVVPSHGLDWPDQLPPVSLALAIDRICQPEAWRPGPHPHLDRPGLAQCLARLVDLYPGRNTDTLRSIQLAQCDRNSGWVGGWHRRPGYLGLARKRVRRPLSANRSRHDRTRRQRCDHRGMALP